MINRLTAINYKGYQTYIPTQTEQRTVQQPNTNYTANIYPTETVKIYNEQPIITEEAQLSLGQMHDFHGQSIPMERAFSIMHQFDNNTLFPQNNFFDKDKPVDKLKCCCGDMYLGEEPKNASVVNKFLNISGIEATAIGNHELDIPIEQLVDIVNDRQYKFLGANMHPDKDSAINKILSKSYIKEINGNKYGIIGLVPPDIEVHLKYPEKAEEFHIADIEQTKNDLQHEVDELKKQGVNKIILLSHVGLRSDKYLAQNVNGVDVILSAHTHSYLGDVKEGENLLRSPSGEPVLITQVGRDGEFIAFPNVKFNKLGQITDVQYNIVKTEDFPRNLIARNLFEKILGKPEVVGSIKSIENPNKDIYAYENPNCDFILDSMRAELGTDIAIMNSANIRGHFSTGKLDTRDLAMASPFGNKVCIVNVSEDELVSRIEKRIKLSMTSKSHRPGILQVSGLKYTYSMKDAKLLSLTFIDKNGKEQTIDLANPRKDKLYTMVADDFCITSPDSGMDLTHRYNTAIKKFDTDKDVFVADYLRKHSDPIEIKPDGRIKAID